MLDDRPPKLCGYAAIVLSRELLEPVAQFRRDCRPDSFGTVLHGFTYRTAADAPRVATLWVQRYGLSRQPKEAATLWNSTPVLAMHALC